MCGWHTMGKSLLLIHIHTYTHTYIHTYIHTCINSSKKYVRLTYNGEGLTMFKTGVSSMCTCVYVCVHVLYIYIYIYMQVCACTHTHTYISVTCTCMLLIHANAYSHTLWTNAEWYMWNMREPIWMETERANMNETQFSSYPAHDYDPDMLTCRPSKHVPCV
jgi:hypothetical protein